MKVYKVKEFYTLDTTMFDSTKHSNKEMYYHEAEFEGDKHYVDVFNSDGTKSRYFNIDFVEFE